MEVGPPKGTSSDKFKKVTIENSFDMCTIQFKLGIFEFLYSWLVNPIDVITLLMRGRPQAEAVHASSLLFIEICGSDENKFCQKGHNAPRVKSDHWVDVSSSTIVHIKATKFNLGLS